MSSLKQLQQQYDLLGEKIHRLKTALIIETDAATIFKLEKQLEATEQEQKQIEQRLEGQEWLAVTCPYRSLFAFREQDERFFFGRDAYTQKLIAAVQSRSLIAVIGASGSGKSSLVYAGLIPALRHQGLWHILSFRPGNRPFHELLAAMIPIWRPELSKGDQLVEINKVSDYLHHKRLTLREIIEDMHRADPNFHLLLFAD